MGMGVVLTMDNRLSGPTMAASASMKMLTAATTKAQLAQARFQMVMKAGVTLMIGAAGMSVALGLLTASAAGFETGMARVAAILKPTREEMAKLTDVAIRAGIATQFSPKTATEGLKDLATAGFTATEATEALFPVLDLATGSLGQLGVSGAATAAAAAVRGFGFQAKDTVGVVDTLLRSTQLTNIQARDLQLMLARAGGAAAAAGQEFETTVAVLGAMRNIGAEASVAGTTFRSALRAMTKVPAKQELQRLNVALFDAHDNFRDVADVVFDLNKALVGQTEKQKEATLKTIFGARGLQMYNAVSRMGAENMNKLVGELENAGGTAAEFRKAVLEPLSGRLVLMIGSIQTLASQIGAPLLAPIKRAVTAFTGFLNFVIRLTQAHPILTSVIMKTVGLTTLVVGLVGTLMFLSSALLLLNSRYQLVAAAKAAYFFITSLVVGIEEFSRKQLLLSLFVGKLALTQQTLTNAKIKARIILEKILGIGISTRTSITYASVSAAWAERIAALGTNAALLIQNTLRRISNLLTLKGIKGMFFSAKAAVVSSTAMTGAAAATGIFSGAIKGLTVAMMANPILLIITAAIVLAVVFYKVAKAFWNAKGASQALFGFLLILMSPLGIIIVLAKIFLSAWKKNLAGVRTAFSQMKKAIMSIFEPLSTMFTMSEKGGKSVGGLFKSIMTLVMRPLALVFTLIARVATVAGAVVQIFVQEFRHAFVPLKPIIDDLSKAFDELSIALFGKGKANISFWKKFGTVVRGVIRGVLVPLAKVVGFLVRLVTALADAIRSVIEPLGKIGGKVVGAVKKVGGFLGGIWSGAKGLVGLQHGGIITRPTPAMLAETGRPELVMPLPTGLRPGDLKEAIAGTRRPDAPATATPGPIRIVLENRIYLDSREIHRSQREIEETDLLRDFGVTFREA